MRAGGWLEPVGDAGRAEARRLHLGAPQLEPSAAGWIVGLEP
jgi:hypothetical protein